MQTRFLVSSFVYPCVFLNASKEIFGWFYLVESGMIFFETKHNEKSW